MTRIGLRLHTAVERPPRGVIERVGNYWSCDLADGTNGAQTMIGLRSLIDPGKVVGPAVTVNSIVSSINIGKFGLEYCQDGDVLVIAAPAATSPSPHWASGSPSSCSS